MRCALLVLTLVGCAPQRSIWDHLAFGDPVDLHDRSAATESTFQLTRDDALVGLLGVPPAANDRDDPSELHRITTAVGTIIASSGGGHGVRSEGVEISVSGPATFGPFPITFDEVQSLYLIEDGEQIAAVYTTADRLVSLRFDPRTGAVVRPQRTAIDHLPICKPEPWISGAVALGGFLFVAVKANAMGEHGPCAGYTEANVDFAAIFVLAADGRASEAMVLPHRDRPAMLAVREGVVVGTQAPDVGFRILVGGADEHRP